MSAPRTQLNASARLSARLPGLFAAAVGALVIALSYGVFAGWTTMRADLSTYVLPGAARAKGLGLLYVDYFDIKPPLTYAMFLPWLDTIGPSLAGLWVLYAALLAAMLLAFWIALRQQLAPWYALVLFGSASAVVVYFAMLEEIFFITEVVCLVLALWSLVIARRLGSHLGWLFAAAVLMATAGQVKEVFILAPLALVPIALANPRRWPALATVAAGVVTTVLATGVVLLWWGNGVLAAYAQVLTLKRSRFPAPGPGESITSFGEVLAQFAQWLPLIGVFLVTVIVLAILERNRARQGRNPLPSSWFLTPAEWGLATFFIVTLAAFIWQGAPPIRHYAVALVFPLYLVLSVLFLHGIRSAAGLRTTWRRTAIALLVIPMLPPTAALLWGYGRTTALRPLAIIRAGQALEPRPDLAFYDGIRELAGPRGCLQVAYGWSASATYLYSGLPPCSRFVVPPLALTPDLRDELRHSLITRPPNVLVVDPGLSSETTVPEAEGTPDTAVFPFVAVATHCYKASNLGPTVYVPAADPPATSACIAEQVAATH